MTQSLQNLPLGDSDVESDDEYLHDGEVEETEEDKRMSRFITAVRNGWVKIIIGCGLFQSVHFSNIRNFDMIVTGLGISINCTE